MLKIARAQLILSVALTIGMMSLTLSPGAAAVRIEGHVQAGGGPLANSVVTLWAASTGEPRQLGQARKIVMADLN
jgi:hypothetical protein